MHEYAVRLHDKEREREQLKFINSGREREREVAILTRGEDFSFFPCLFAPTFAPRCCKLGSAIKRVIARAYFAGLAYIYIYIIAGGESGRGSAAV